MSLRNRLAKDEENVELQNDQLEQQVDEQVVEPVVEDTVNEEPVVEEPVVEEQPQTTSVKDQYGEDYTNQWGKVTPYHIIFKDFGNEIAGMSTVDAVKFTLDKLNELNNTYGGDKDYTNPSPSAIKKFETAINKKSRNGMDVLFKVKDFLLASEGLSVVSSLEDAFTSPKLAKRVAQVFNTLLEIDKNVKIKSLEKKAASNAFVETFLESNGTTDTYNKFYNLVRFLEGNYSQILEEFLKTQAEDNKTVVGPENE